ncbi:MAG: ferredoxin family protein [Tannerella sp.]|jgi:NAD-dependent dihydropyrimidine dehydrogenase PreA subunit|nr:ferredoxin family protein [Tannerella sp.]
MSLQDIRVTICACASRSFIDKDKAAGIAAAMKKEGYEVAVEADLCRKVMLQSPDMRQIAAGIILACYPRAIRSLLDRLGLAAGRIVDIRSGEGEDVLAGFGISCSDGEGVNDLLKNGFLEEIERFPVENGTDAWYPALDKERCRECGKCHDFCLFGVYAVENKQVKVVRPQNCKNNCPACARMCPGRAIIFPKYEKSPINGGTADEETFDPEEMNKMYSERLRMRLQQRRMTVPLTKR